MYPKVGRVEENEKNERKQITIKCITSGKEQHTRIQAEKLLNNTGWGKNVKEVNGGVCIDLSSLYVLV
jgi:hypothetical protein